MKPSMQWQIPFNTRYLTNAQGAVADSNTAENALWSWFFFLLPGVGDPELAVLVSRYAGGSVAPVRAPLRLDSGPHATVVVLALWEAGDRPTYDRVVWNVTALCQLRGV